GRGEGVAGRRPARGGNGVRGLFSRDDAAAAGRHPGVAEREAPPPPAWRRGRDRRHQRLRLDRGHPGVRRSGPRSRSHPARDCRDALGLRRAVRPLRGDGGRRPRV
ncbi:MAG: hypothetical protein AVDCRST_MAG59-1189, partial [uncultured Thermomicrobiales bacterium]